MKDRNKKLVGVNWKRLIVHSSSFIIHRSLFSLHRSLFIVHCSAFIVLFAASIASGENVAVPAAINYQGKLTNPSDGTSVQAGLYNIEFRVWDDPIDAATNDLIWGRVFAVHVMTNGVFNVLLTDDGTEVTSPSAQTNDIRQAFQGEDRYLGLTITHGPSGNIASPEISPRQRLVSAPFALHSQNATDSFHAEHADEAVLAQDSEKLGGKLANKYYDDARFDAVGLDPTYLTLMGWQSGGNVIGTSLYDYWGNFSMGGPTQPDIGIKLLVKDGKIQADEGIIANGSITPAVGAGTGIVFPDNIGGGTGDNASIQYYARTNEDCTLKLAVGNDSEDNLDLRASGTIEMHGKVSAFGGLVYEHNVIDGDYDVNAPSDGFYYIYSDNVAYDVTLGGENWYLRTVDDDDHNINLQSYPIAKGERFKVHLDDNWTGTSHLKVYWRPFGR